MSLGDECGHLVQLLVGDLLLFGSGVESLKHVVPSTRLLVTKLNARDALWSLRDILRSQVAIHVNPEYQEIRRVISRLHDWVYCMYRWCSKSKSHIRTIEFEKTPPYGYIHHWKDTKSSPISWKMSCEWPQVSHIAIMRTRLRTRSELCHSDV